VRIGRAAGIGALGVFGGVLALPVLVFLIIVVLTLVGVTHLYRIPSSAMEPTLHCSRPDPGCEATSKDRIFTVKYLFSSPGRGDIIVFHTPSRAESECGTGGVYVKRIVGLPGEKWQEQKGRIYIDGQLLREPYIHADRRDTFNRGPVRVPEGSYFVLGDNRAASCDSRNWGPLPRSKIIGRVIATYWPLSRIALH
jgi:signal peptidase I